MDQRSESMGTGVRNKLSAGRQMARDISESLGKLPPQAPDLEEAIIGALMLEKNALPAVKGFLKPHHFYVEKHKIIYEAILGVADNEKIQVDMRSVVQELRKLGKLELVEGAHAIADLTSKVSSAANIEYHARIVMEMSLKRSLIEIASRIHTDAYDDTTDVFELLDKTELYLKVAVDGTLVKTSEAKVKEQWETRFLTTAPAKSVPLVVLDGCPVVTRGNYTLLIGKKKTRKTLFMVWLISEYLKHHPEHANRIILFDTEQGQEEVWEMRDKIRKLTGKLVPVAFMRGLSPKERKDFIWYTVQYWPERPVMLCIDGVRDLMSNINDPDESTDLMVWMDRLTMENDLGIINVIHMNKNDQNARGHIGTELGNKSLCTVEMALDEKSGLTVVSCESSRKKPFDKFAFTHLGDGLPGLADLPASMKSALPKPERDKRINAVFEEGPLNYSDAWKAIGINFEVGANKAKQLLQSLVRDGIVQKSAKVGKDSMYKLVSLDGNSESIPAKATTVSGPKIDAPAEEETDLFSGNTDDLPF